MYKILRPKNIDAELKGSVTLLVRKERKNITKIQLEGATIDNIIGSLAALYDSVRISLPVSGSAPGAPL